MCCDDKNQTTTIHKIPEWISVEERLRLRGIDPKSVRITNTVRKSNGWRDAGSFVSALVHPGKIKSFAKAVASKLLEGPASDHDINHRWSCCFGVTIEGEKVSEPCRSLYQDGDNYYCRSCGCGSHKRAQLNPRKPGDYTTSKLAYPDLRCPLGKFSPVKGRKKSH